MREIIFRGKRIDNGEWVEGLYAKTIQGNSVIFNTIEEYPCGFCMEMLDSNYVVIPETLGQYTGLTDRNGKKIFEGDIIRHYNRHDETDYFYIGVIEWDEEKYGFANRFVKENRLFFVSDRCIYEVIGNIHDNPELLGGK